MKSVLHANGFVLMLLPALLLSCTTMSKHPGPGVTGNSIIR